MITNLILFLNPFLRVSPHPLDLPRPLNRWTLPQSLPLPASTRLYLTHHSGKVTFLSLLQQCLTLSISLVFTRDELRDALLPVLDMVYHQGPEAVPFWEPVDPNALGIPVCHTHTHAVWLIFLFYFFQDYFDVIKSPMDLRTIRNRLEGGDYTNPWEVSLFILPYFIPHSTYLILPYSVLSKYEINV